MSVSAHAKIHRILRRADNIARLGSRVFCMDDCQRPQWNGASVARRRICAYLGRIAVAPKSFGTDKRGFPSMTDGSGFDALFRTNSGRASLNPIFSWVRLAQRVPVRIHIDQVPDGVRLAAGMTATVQIDSQPEASKR